MDFYWDADFRDPERYVSAESKITNHEVIVPDLATLTDEEFLERIAAMKRNHRRTLELCDNVGLKPPSTPLSDYSPSRDKPSLPVASVNRDYVISTKSFSSPAGDLITTTGREMRMPFKARRAPPRPKVQADDAARQLRTKRKSSAGHNSSSNEAEQLCDMKVYMMERYLTACKNDLAVTEGFWNELYALKKSRRHSSSDRSFQSRNKSFDNSWRHLVTVPKPFAMTIRESVKPRPVSRSMADFEQTRDAQTRKKMQERKKKFKASPAPANIYVPLYEELTKDREKQRLLNAARKQREVEDLRRSYAFLLREDERRAKKTRRQTLLAVADSRSPDAVFRAKPFPEHIYNSETNEVIKQQELQRQEDRLNRAEAMLQLSQLPPNMKKGHPKHCCEMSQEHTGRMRSQSPAKRNASSNQSDIKSNHMGNDDPKKHHHELEEIMAREDSKIVNRLPEKWPKHNLRSQDLWRSLTDLLSDSQDYDASMNVKNSNIARNLSGTSQRTKKTGPTADLRHRRPPVPKPRHSTASVNHVRSLRAASSHSGSSSHDRIRREIEEDLRNMDLTTN